MAPVRGCNPGLADTDQVRVWVPVCCEVGLTVSQPESLDGVQVQDSELGVTLNWPLVPATGAVPEIGSIVKLHEPAVCVTWNVLPPAETLPVRGTASAFADAVQVTSLLPVC